jgi:Flp pilus assembly protein TadD
VELDPGYADGHYFLGLALSRANDLPGAVTHLEQAAELVPGEANYHYQLARALHRHGNAEAAAERYREVVRLMPSRPEGYNGVAWILATHRDPRLRDPDEALRLAAEACRITGNKRPEYLDTLAAAQAAAGQFDKAVATADRALALAREKGHTALATEIEQRLVGYRSRRAHGGEAP